MSTSPSEIRDLQRVAATALHRHWKLFLGEGIVLVVLGIAAIAIPPAATLAITLLVGWVFLLSGIAGLATTVMMRGAPGFGWALVSAVLGIAAGLVLLVSPLGGALSLTIILIAFFAIEGIASILFAMDHKRELSGNWGLMLASGVLDLVIAVIVLAGLPGTAAWAIGLLVGINMLFGGVALVAMAMHARTAT